MPDQSAPVGMPTVALLFALFVSLLAGFAYALVAIWPPDCVNNQCLPHTARLFFWSINLDRAENLLLLVGAAGALGALIHVTSSFADYVGNRQLVLSWVWWLLLRVPIGVALALVFYMLIRGGLIIPNSSTEPQINPYGAAGLAALVGMFAKQATDKLAEIFENLFRSDKERARSEPLTPSGAPDLRGLDPANVTAGSANVVVRLVGDRFADDVAVTINQTGVKPLAAARNEVRVAVPDPMLSSPGTLTVQAINPGRSGGVSQRLPLVVTG